MAKSKTKRQRSRSISQAQKLRQQTKPVQPVADLPPSQDESTTLQPLLVSVAQLCELLNVSRSTLYRMEQSGSIPGRVKIGGQVRYHLETIEGWLRDQARKD